MKGKIAACLILSLGIMILACGGEGVELTASLEHIQNQEDKLAPVILTDDLGELPDQEVEVLKLIVKAARYMDDAFLVQVNGDNPDLLRSLEAANDDHIRPYLEYFKIMFGPWDRLDDDRPFIGTKIKPAGANYYPPDLTREDFRSWIQNHPDDRETFESEFTMIRRRMNNLVAIPYSDYFKAQLKPAAALLKEAAALTSDRSLATFLNSRADAFLSDDYFQSDMDWMDLAGDIEVVIGPYEVYEDGLMGYKAAFESFVCVVDHEASRQQADITGMQKELENQLPVPDHYKNYDRGTDSPIKVVNLVFSAGDTKAGIQTTAFNLPNDERVREAKGSKKVMLKNVMRAKFDQCWIPIVNTVLAPATLKRVSFDGYFYHVLLHEVSHGLGPGTITLNGEKTTVGKALKELYSIIEEAKADVVGMYMTQYLIDRGTLPRSLENELYASNLGGMFRSIRFGIDEAHGAGVAIQLNYYMDQGACHVTPDGKFEVNDRKYRKAVKSLAEKLLLIEAHGDYEAAADLIAEYREIRPEVRAALDRLSHVPIDIRPVYPVEDEI